MIGCFDVVFSYFIYWDFILFFYITNSTKVYNNDMYNKYVYQKSNGEYLCMLTWRTIYSMIIYYRFFLKIFSTKLLMK